MANPPPITNPTPSTHVSSLPPSNGRQEGKGWEKTVGAFNITTKIDKLVGSVTVPTVAEDLIGPMASLEITTEKGRIRAYIQDGKEYQYIEATPGNPGRIRGHLLWSGGYYQFRLEAADGEAENVIYHVWRSR